MITKKTKDGLGDYNFQPYTKTSIKVINKTSNKALRQIHKSTRFVLEESTLQLYKGKSFHLRRILTSFYISVYLFTHLIDL